MLFLHIQLKFANSLAVFSAEQYKSVACLNRYLPSIPKDHLFYSKKQPLILGHRGQGKKFQENTIEGIKSLIGTGADGFEADVVLTNYGQLVLFHSDNAKVNAAKFPLPSNFVSSLDTFHYDLFFSDIRIYE